MKPIALVLFMLALGACGTTRPTPPELASPPPAATLASDPAEGSGAAGGGDSGGSDNVNNASGS